MHRATGRDCFVLRAIGSVRGELAAPVDAIGPFGPVTTRVVSKGEPPKPIGLALLAAARR